MTPNPLKTITLTIDNDTIAQLVDLLIDVEDHMRTEKLNEEADKIEEVILQLMNQEDPNYSSGALSW